VRSAEIKNLKKKKSPTKSGEKNWEALGVAARHSELKKTGLAKKRANRGKNDCAAWGEKGEAGGTTGKIPEF